MTEAVYLAGALTKERELLSLAYLYLGANTPFERAGKYKTSKINAKQWLDYARAEGVRVKELREAGAKLEGCGV